MNGKNHLHGLPLPKRGQLKKTEKIHTMLDGMSIESNQHAIIESPPAEFEYICRVAGGRLLADQ